jgi:hypothetical protein
VPILDTQGQDISSSFIQGASAAEIPLQLALACGQAESSLDPRAERWGKETTEAKQAIAQQDWTALQGIITRAGSDVSFGIGQRVVRFHYTGDRSMTVQNCLAVRQYVFDHEDQDIREMCAFLRPRYQAAQTADLTPVGGDVLLMALCAYNAGHPPLPTESYWVDRAPTVQRYRQKLLEAQTILATLNAAEENATMSIEQFEQQHANRLGPRWQNKPIRNLGETVRIAGYARHILVEIDGETWPVKMDESFFL